MKKKFSKIYIEITNVCNLKCEFCLETKREKKFMDINEFEYILNNIKDYTDLILLHVKGEPLLHPNLKEILKVCERNYIKVNITTNTTLLKENLSILSESKSLRQLNLSIHDLEQNNINTEKGFIDIVKYVKLIKKQNKNLIISYRLWNINEIGRNDRNRNFLNILEDEYNIVDIYQKCIEKNFVELEENVFLNQDIEFEWPSLKQEIISESGKCYGLKNQIAILVSGDVVPCCLDTDGDMVLGNIFKQDLEEILNTSRAQKIVEGFNKSRLVEELCKRCDFIKKFN